MGKNYLDLPHNSKVLAVVRQVTNLNVTFSELSEANQAKVLSYIEKRRLGLRIFSKKWFDLITNKFYVKEYRRSSDSWVVTDTAAFDNFRDFYDYVQGDIYDDACFYGYTFSQDEIKDYGIKLDQLNFDSFITETIDDLTLERVETIEKLKSKEELEQADNLLEFIEENRPYRTFKKIERIYKMIVRRYGDIVSRQIFFSYIVVNYKESAKDALIEFACKYNHSDGFSFIQALIIYGTKAAEYVAYNFEGRSISYSTHCKWSRAFRNALNSYEANIAKITRISAYYDATRHLYRADFALKKETKSDCEVPIAIFYFRDFFKFADFLNRDLSGANLSNAPLKSEELKEFKTDSKTVYPHLGELPSKCTIEKCFREEDFYGNSFLVKKTWTSSNGNVLKTYERRFSRCFDFIHYLKGDLSNADLLMCDGIENLSNVKGLILDNIKVSSKANKAMGLPVNELSKDEIMPRELALTKENELATIQEELIDDSYYKLLSQGISYVTDIHLHNRFKNEGCLSRDDRQHVIRIIAKNLAEQSTDITIIGGDTSYDIDLLRDFLKELSSRKSYHHFFFTLGNHELWPFTGVDLEKIVGEYRSLVGSMPNIHFLHNNVFLRRGKKWLEISEEQLNALSISELRKMTRDACLVVFGGIGFSGMNDRFNANNLVYATAINREQEIKESKKFLRLYKKATKAFIGRNLVVASHMPIKDWAGEMEPAPGVIHISGHTHRSFFYDDGVKRIFANNQVGYGKRNVYLKRIYLDFDFDWFADYKDGIHKIKPADYERFYDGIGEDMSFNAEFRKLYMLKNNGSYMFLMENKNGKIMVLNGGRPKHGKNRPVEYYYDNLDNYSKSVKLFLSNYDSFQKSVAAEVKRIGGEGTIHGCIVDIDYLNHLYLNPIDGKITPYFAYSMINKYVYADVSALLKDKCPSLYKNYQKLTDGEGTNNPLAIRNQNLPSSMNATRVASTEMYKISRIIKNLQFTTKYNVVRLWNDDVIGDVSEENGRLIVTNMIEQIDSDNKER